jgi:hypothetical protein
MELRADDRLVRAVTQGEARNDIAAGERRGWLHRPLGGDLI